MIDTSDEDSISGGSCFTDQEAAYLAHLIDSNISSYMKSNQTPVAPVDNQTLKQIIDDDFMKLLNLCKSLPPSTPEELA